MVEIAKHARSRIPLPWVIRGIICIAIVVFGIWLMIDQLLAPAPRQQPDDRSGIVRLVIDRNGVIHGMDGSPLGNDALRERFERVLDWADADAEPKLVIHADRRAPAAALLLAVSQARAHGLPVLHMAMKDTHGLEVGLAAAPTPAAALQVEPPLLSINREGEVFIEGEAGQPVAIARTMLAHRQERGDAALVVRVDARCRVDKLVALLEHAAGTGVAAVDLRPLDGAVSLLRPGEGHDGVPPDSGIPLGDPLLHDGPAPDLERLLATGPSPQSLLMTRRLPAEPEGDVAFIPDSYFTLGPLPPDRTLSPTAGDSLASIYTALGGSPTGWGFVALDNATLHPPEARPEAAFFATTTLHAESAGAWQLHLSGPVTSAAINGTWLDEDVLAPVDQDDETPITAMGGTIELNEGWNTLLLRLGHRTASPKALVMLKPTK